MENLNIFIQGLIFVSSLIVVRIFVWKILTPFLWKVGEILPKRLKFIPNNLSIAMFISVFLITTITMPISLLYFGIIGISFLVIRNLTIRNKTI